MLKDVIECGVDNAETLRVALELLGCWLKSCTCGGCVACARLRCARPCGFAPAHTWGMLCSPARLLQCLDAEWFDILKRVLEKHFSFTDPFAVYARAVNTLSRVVAWGTCGVGTPCWSPWPWSRNSPVAVLCRCAQLPMCGRAAMLASWMCCNAMGHNGRPPPQRYGSRRPWSVEVRCVAHCNAWLLVTPARAVAVCAMHALVYLQPRNSTAFRRRPGRAPRWIAHRPKTTCLRRRKTRARHLPWHTWRSSRGRCRVMQCVCGPQAEWCLTGLARTGSMCALPPQSTCTSLPRTHVHLR